MKKKIISILTATAMAVTFIPTFAFAEEGSNRLDSAVDAKQSTDEIEVNKEVKENIDYVGNISNINSKNLEVMDELGDVDVTVSDDDSIIIHVACDEPIQTEEVDGEDVETFEDIELIVDNSTDMDVEDCAEVIAEEADGEYIEEENTSKSFENIVGWILPEECYADNNYDTYTKPLGKVNAIVGFSYKQKGWFVKPIYSRVKLKKKKKCTLKQIHIKSIENASQTYEKAKRRGSCKKVSTTNSFINAAPKTGEWYYCYFDNKDRWAWSNFSVWSDTFVRVKYGSKTVKSFTRCREFFQGQMNKWDEN